jgi:hypothetical protein
LDTYIWNDSDSTTLLNSRSIRGTPPKAYLYTFSYPYAYIESECLPLSQW